MAFSIIDNGNYDIHIWDLAQENMTKITFESSYDINPIWTPDGNRILFLSSREGIESIFWKAADGSGRVEKLASVADRIIVPWSISNDGNTLFLREGGGEGAYNISILPMEGDGTVKLLLKKQYGERHPQISPDDRWLAYESDESGSWEIYVRPFPDVDGGLWQVSDGGGKFPVWSPDCKELFYSGPDEIMAVSVETNPIFKSGMPKVLFQNKYEGPFEIDPTRKRFLMRKLATTVDGESLAEIPRKINIVLNWFEELKQRVPVD